jgi:DNA polymerase I-like protein with 3'-5' exonuclease and polymerase domains
MFLQRMDDRVSVTRPWFDQYKFHLVKTVDQLKKLVDFCIQRKRYSIDLETTGVDNRVYPDEYFNDGIRTRFGMRTVDTIAGVCMSFDGENGYYIPVAHEPEDSGNLPWDPAWDELTRLVNSGSVAVLHNAKFDCEFLYPVTGKDFWKIDEYEDTMLMAKVINPLKSSPAGLKPLTKLHFGVEMVEIDELFTQERKDQLKREKKRYNFAMMHPKEGLEYGCSDGIFTYKLQSVLREKLSESDVKIYNLEKSFCNVIREMERNRVHIDVDRVQQLYVECKAELEAVGNVVRDILERHTGSTGRWKTLNVGSPKQLSIAILTDPEGMRLKPTPEMIEAMGEGGSPSDSDDEDEDDSPDGEEQKQYSLKDEALKSLNLVYGAKYAVQREGHVDKDGKQKTESLFDLILEYRHYDKMKGSYVEKLVLAVDKNGDVRPSFNQMGTDTARLSSKAGEIENGYSGVNFQGIPRDSDEDKPELFKQIRTCIAPRPGWVLVKLDYAGEELRVVTNLSGDPIWTKSFLYEDGDVHSITARTLFGKSEINKDERNRGKRCNFAFIYGGGAGAIQRNVGGSIEDATRHMQNLKNDVPVLMGYVDHQKAYARKHKCIYTAFGRKLPIPTIESPIRGIRAKAERCAINYTIQATSADVIKYAMCFVDKQLRTLGWKDRCRYVLTVHDEVVYEVRPEHLMEIVRKLDEWMVLPWKLPKAHGRDWVVPLVTEPGIDVNWKARYDYFKMVDGTPAAPKDLGPDGSFKGKLKKDEYFADGRIYQKVPDFLEGFIRRIPPGEAVAPSLPDQAAPGLPAPDSPPPEEPALALPDPRMSLSSLGGPTPVPEQAAEAVPTPEPPPVEEAVQPHSAEESKMDFDDIELDLGAPSGIVQELAPSNDPGPPSSSPPESAAPSSAPPKAASPPSPPRAPQALSLGADGGKVHRWVIKAALSEYSQRRLHAVCILSEGGVPLRVVSPAGQVLVSEEDGVLVDPAEFEVLTRLFGL